jgi:hypothetical protein
MDPASISAAVVAFLAPYLAEGGKAAAKKVGEKIVDALERRFQGQIVPETALADMKDEPQDPDNQASLRKEIKKALRSDADFQAELTSLLEEAEEKAPETYHAVVRGSGAIAQGAGAVAAGARGVAVGGNVEGGVIVTGDDNEVDE